MKIRFWGSRGSLPVSLNATGVRQKLIDALEAARDHHFENKSQIENFIDHELPFKTRGSFGGNTSCVEIDIRGNERVICDMGSGARSLAENMIARFGPKGQTYHIFMSHMHWDHMMGFPFFTPIYIPGNRIIIHGCHANLEDGFRRQHASPGFPVDFDALAAQIEFSPMIPGETYEIAGLRVSTKLQNHGGDSYGFRFTHMEKVLIYATDAEYKVDDVAENETFVRFFQNADLVIFDAMYSLAEAISVKIDWGHSSNIIGVELCQQAGVKRFCLFHHEPAHNDETIARIFAETVRFEEITRLGLPLEIICAYDGLEVEL